MKSIKTLDEYKASKVLLFSYVTSEEVVKVIGEDTADNIVTFLRSNVFVHEQHFARCFYLDDEDHKKPLHARTNTSAHVLPTSESILQQAMVASESYISYHVCEHKWWVLYSGHCNLPVRLLPVFARFGTNFESFTHHLVDIPFWTAYSLYFEYVVVLDPSELNEDELNKRIKLVTARWKSSHPPTAPVSMKSMYEGRYSVGSKSQDNFKSMTGEELFLHVETLMKNKLYFLNYDIDSVEKAFAIMENHHGNAVRMTQEMHNCSADLFFVGPGDETLDTTKPWFSRSVEPIVQRAYSIV
ncbi:hypothetical protein IV203_033739 [Nitzschia inconspicua]|uniref:Uncharacterized protein n=1 Tax=Nitzschia inconspicua TaxID=303405 RepID=A0A9K3Q7A1_9STRA|nr:hypothetical protein IV203_033739 [Nitzschia inconspicua]